MINFALHIELSNGISRQGGKTDCGGSYPTE
jgi:hypothetical protein